MYFRFSGTLLRFTNYQKQVEVDASALPEALTQLAARFPALQNVLYDRLGNVRASHSMFLNGEQLVSTSAPTLGKEDVVEVLTAIAGG